MKFRDGVERDPEEYGYQVFTQKQLDAISKKRKDNPDYKKSLEHVKDFTQTQPVFMYKIKLKDLDVGEGFHDANIHYVCMRIE